MPMPCALRATVLPMRPRPMTPSFLPSSSKPVRPALGHSPAFMPASARGTWRASANSSDSACSAAASVLPSGAFITAMPFAVAASTSIVSTPAPARPITFSCLALAIASAVTCVEERTSNASTPSSAARQLRGVLDRFGNLDIPSGFAEQGQAVFMDTVTRQHFHRTLLSGKVPAEAHAAGVTAGAVARGDVHLRRCTVGASWSEKRGRLAWESATTAA